MRVADPGKMFVCCLASRKAVRQGEIFKPAVREETEGKETKWERK